MRKDYKVTASALIQAAAENVYAILPDYRESHPLILPRTYFTRPEVERGGRGEGTVIRFRMRLPGRERDFRTAVAVNTPDR